MTFKIKSDYRPSGDQPKAIKKLVEGLNANVKEQILLGVTGSGKTFTIANIIEQTQRPALIMAHNKTLAAQLYGEMKEFFPDNEVGYFVSFYDYYQPEAYIAKTDTYIEKDSTINEQIDRLRHAATRSLFESNHSIVVASVSCIYGIGSPEYYSSMVLKLKVGDEVNLQKILLRLVDLQYKRNDIGYDRGIFKVKGDILDIYPSHLDGNLWRFSFFGDEIEDIKEIDPLTGEVLSNLNNVSIYPNSHYVTPANMLMDAVGEIKNDLRNEVARFEAKKMLLEAQRLEQRVSYDIEMMVATGTCKGIENYSRYLTARPQGSPPPTLFEYLPTNALLFVDESHVSIPQVGGMYKGDLSRKSNLVSHGFRLESALDNRPLKFEEWEYYRPQTIYVSATPGKYELNRAENHLVEQIIRPTGLVDPVCEVRPVETQVDDLIGEVRNVKERGFRVLVTTLTKKMAQDLTTYFLENGINTTYLHSDIDTLERVEIIQDLRSGKYDCLVGVNLLREGLDIPECALVGILDADKEGFLRNETSLIQTIGRAARNSESKVILYADKITNSINKALSENKRRREIQLKYNEVNNITPKTTVKPFNNSLLNLYKNTGKEKDKISEKVDEIEIIKNKIKGGDYKYLDSAISNLKKEMTNYASELDFENAVIIREKIKKLQTLYN